MMLAGPIEEGGRRAAVAAQMRRHRRLLVLCGLSALVHLALLDWVTSTMSGKSRPLPGVPTADTLMLRIAPATATQSRRQAAPGGPAAAPLPRSGPPDRGPASHAGVLDASRPVPTAAALPTTAPPAGTPMPDAQADAAAPVEMPSRYRVRMPAPVLLTYTQTRQSAQNMAPERLPDARIDWRSDGEHYQLDVTGVLGRLRSEGGTGDAGVLPARSVEELDGEQQLTEIVDGQVHFRANGRSVPESVGIQDRASLLIQLVGMGLGEPNQIRDVIKIVVAGATDAVIERYDVIGLETLATPLGEVTAWHLAQRVAPGQPRLEVWLAPAHGWLPLQLRLTGADGCARTQTISAIAGNTMP